ncbi:amino acid-binding protein [Arthrobacter ruber]|uniref:amino acid-binding protein n=1 Tax=Arthrobacter ruber TaxID=1258893 RepID=UPI000CF4D818|nr:amino acid-binding protein [Arthrobacter ruber]
MTRSTGSTAASLRCDSCGQLPEPGKVRLTLANVAVMLPIELAVHAVIVQTHLSYPLKVLILALTATALVIWVAEPSVMRFLRAWLHAPALRQRRHLDTATDLWRARVLVEESPGALERVSHQLARRGVNILSLQIHPGAQASVDEFVLAVPAGVSEQDLVRAFTAGGSLSARVWPSTALALADGQTKALSLACRVAQDPAELRYAVAELLMAEPVLAPSATVRSFVEGSEVLKIPSPAGEPLVFSRVGDPFTAAESARAHRLSELAAVATHPTNRIF